MSLNFYADQNLTLKITQSSPKRFLFPNKGNTKTSQLFLADPYFSTCSVQANPADTILNLTDTSEFMDATAIAATSSGYATAVAGSNVIQYTGKTQSTLTGVSGIASTINVTDKVYPWYVYYTIEGGNLTIVPVGPDLSNYQIKVALGSTPSLGFPGLPAIFNVYQINNQYDIVEVYLSVQVPAGADQEFIHFELLTNNLYRRDINDSTPYDPSEFALAPTCELYAYRHDFALQLPIRLLPASRRVFPNSPGFIVGQYRWRGSDNRNAAAIVPANWNIDPNTIGLEKFIAGIGFDTDLQPDHLQQDNDSIRMVMHRGEYFTGANRYYLPANWNLEFFPSGLGSANMDGTVTIHLANSPREEAPVFVGTYVLDNQGFYEQGIHYDYVASIHNPDGSMRTDLPDRYYTMNKATKTITLNKVMGHPVMFLGAVSGESVDYFDVPIYPIASMDTVYIDQGATVPKLYATVWTLDVEKGTLQLPNVPGSLDNEPVFAVASPMVAVLYDSGPDDTREIETVDFNPAFSGLASGYFYLQHRKQTPSSLVLSCDKPQIPIPATQASIIGLVAYGPVYFTNDYALLSVTAYGPVPGETIPNARLDVVVDPSTFSGTINYQDPLSDTVSVVTGGDGTANMVFIPKGGFGIYLPTIPAAGGLGGVATTSITNDTLVLPADVPLSSIWNIQEGWLVTTYSVLDNNPLLGMVGGNPALGEVPWVTSGTPGDTDYKTNGERMVWRIGGTSFGPIVRPIDAQDVNGHSYTSSLFNGNVRKLIYSDSLPDGGSLANVGAYFLTYIQRVLIKMHLENSNLYSNSILLQMDVPQLINDNPWLILNDQIQGILNQFRLGFSV